jgi:putative transposase
VTLGTPLPGASAHNISELTDRQSIKTATPGKDVGFDRNQKITGRKRHILIETLGLRVAVGSGHTDERQGLVELLTHYFTSGVTWRP